MSLTLQDYHLQEVTLYAKQGRTLGSALSTQDIMALQRQEERRRQQAKQGVFSFYKKSKESSLSTDSLGGRSASPARSDETGRSSSPLQPPARPQRKRRPAPKPPIQAQAEVSNISRTCWSKRRMIRMTSFHYFRAQKRALEIPAKTRWSSVIVATAATVLDTMKPLF